MLILNQAGDFFRSPSFLVCHFVNISLRGVNDFVGFKRFKLLKKNIILYLFIQTEPAFRRTNLTDT
jgi:hypothetical protein